MYLSAVLARASYRVSSCSASPTSTSVGSPNQSDYELSGLFERLLLGALPGIAHPHCTKEILG